MAPKKDQLFSRDKFDAFMGEDDDSVGSARGSSISGKLGGLGGLRAVSPDKPSLGSLVSPTPKSSGLGSLVSPNKPKSGLGGLGGLKSTGGLKGGLSLKPTAGIGGIKSSIKPPEPPISAMSNLSLSTQTENIEALKSITSLLQGLSEKTIAGFQEVSNRLNQTKDEPNLQDSLDELIKNIDDEISAKSDKEVYVIIPGRETSTITEEEIAKIVKGHKVRVFGSVGLLATNL